MHGEHMRRIIKWVGLTLLIALVAVSGALLWYRSASQPTIDGKLEIAGLNAPIDIVRDGEGVPHIYAQSIGDAYFALGFAHAQDRLWQLELNRRIPAGRMAEILGPNALPTDRFLRTLGVRRNAEKIYTNLASDTQAILQAYASGINAYLAKRKGPLPPEFIVTGAPAPGPWHPVDSIGWQTMMAWDLGANWTQEVLRMRLSQRLSLEQINEFLAPYPGEQALKTRDYVKLYRSLTGITQQLTALGKIAPPSYVDGMGSNNWVLAGQRTKSGKPLLANDPHLALSAPSLWYFAHLSAPGLNTIGATLPGIPAVVLGRNDRIAWGFTNTAPDVQDLYIERINPANGKQYQTPAGWAEFQTRIETIKVKGQGDVNIDVQETRHGPVISGALPILEKNELDTRKHVVAFAWTALRPDDLTLQAGIRINLARNWSEFISAVKDFSAPQQSMVYADIDGNIGFVAPGRVPIRKPSNDLKGLAPAPGWDGRYDWSGFIPFEKLPRQFNPASQQVITANEKIVDDTYPYFITSEWALPYRAIRIADMLAASAKHDLNSFGVIQEDIVSLAMQELLPILRSVRPESERAQRAQKMLTAWDGNMAADRAEPLIASAWLRELSRQIFADELGDALMKDYWEHRNFHQAMVNVLRNKAGQAKWCANRTKPEPVPETPCAKQLTVSLDIVLDDLEKRYGKNMSKWQWGIAHTARSEHRPFSRLPALASIFDVRVPTPGDAYTINVGRNNPRNEESPFASRHAPSLRALYDLSDLENSRFMHSTGQSGNVFSPQYRNLAKRWAKAEYLPMQTSRDIVEKNRLGTLSLVPAGK
jgi:penicillin amidase